MREFFTVVEYLKTQSVAISSSSSRNTTDAVTN